MLRGALASAIALAALLVSIGCGNGPSQSCVPYAGAGLQPGYSGQCQSVGGTCSVSCQAGYHEAPPGSTYANACSVPYDPVPSNACGGPPVSNAGIANQLCCLPDSDGGADASTDGASDAAGDSGGCQVTSETDLAGAHIELDASRCVFTLAQAAAGIAVGYDVVVDADVQNVVPRAQDAGGCDAADRSGLIPFELVSGAGQRYCLCDVGLCPAPSGAPVTLLAGRYHHTFTWDGRNWTGPSDTGNPQGAPFPQGTYALRVSAVGSQPADGSTTSFTVAGTLAIRLVP
jgi:hypothetical protein